MEEPKRKEKIAIWLVQQSHVLLQNVKMERKRRKERKHNPLVLSLCPVIVSSAGKCEDFFAKELSEPGRYSKA